MSVRSLIPILAVRDVRKSSEFYQDVLGFEPDDHVLAAQQTPRYGCSKRGDVTIMFHYRDGIEKRTAEEPLRAFDTVLYFYLDDVAGVHQELKAKGYAVSDLAVTGYRMKEFELRDPDGYRMTLGQETDEAPTEPLCE